MDNNLLFSCSIFLYKLVLKYRADRRPTMQYFYFPEFCIFIYLNANRLDLI